MSQCDEKRKRVNQEGDVHTRWCEFVNDLTELQKTELLHYMGANFVSTWNDLEKMEQLVSTTTDASLFDPDPYSISPFRVLGVPLGCVDKQRVEEQFRKLSVRWNPKDMENLDKGDIEMMRYQMRRLKHAYQVVTDPEEYLVWSLTDEGKEFEEWKMHERLRGRDPPSYGIGEDRSDWRRKLRDRSDDNEPDFKDPDYECSATYVRFILSTLNVISALNALCVLCAYGALNALCALCAVCALSSHSEGETDVEACKGGEEQDKDSETEEEGEEEGEDSGTEEEGEEEEEDDAHLYRSRNGSKYKYRGVHHEKGRNFAW